MVHTIVLEPPRHSGMAAACCELEFRNDLVLDEMVSRHWELMISGTNAIKLKLNVLEKVSKHCSTRQARNHRRNCHIRIVSPVEFFMGGQSMDLCC
jgi:hypothetical protein